MSHCGWMGLVREFNASSVVAIVQQLRDRTCSREGSPPSDSQVRAWQASVSALKAAMLRVVDAVPTGAEAGIVLEYELPRESGRRPDAVILWGRLAIVVEFKGHGYATSPFLDQVKAYVRDLQHYHRATHDMQCLPLLALGGRSTRSTPNDHGVRVTSYDDLAQTLVEVVDDEPSPRSDVSAWVDSDYAPLPTLVEAARLIFSHEPLPVIRAAQSAGVPETVRSLLRIAQHAEATSGRHVALVTGVPGSGKTLVGLQFVHEVGSTQAGSREAVFLSGNDPLIAVLQQTLRSRVFVQSVHGFLRSYGGDARKQPTERIWVFDEAQRAWDAERVREKRNLDVSEPEDFIRLGERVPNWCVLVALIGEGQEIHVGEEAGIAQWNAALAVGREQWTVHCPEGVAAGFSHTANVTVEVDHRLNLTKTLRSHVAADVQLWIAALLRGELSASRTLASSLAELGFNMYVTRDLESAKEYVRKRYADTPSRSFGLLASSKARVERYGIDTGYLATRDLRPGHWFADPPESELSSCQLRTAVSEFQCQGLELDLPIVCWGLDLQWQGTSWVSTSPARSKARNPHQLRINSYRVLLSRGRDGLVCFVPGEAALDGAYVALVQCGVRELVP